MNLSIEEHAYPNPAYRYGIFRIDGREIGSAEKNGDGWTRKGGRKVMTAEQMAEALLRDALKDARKRKLQASTDEAAAKMLLRGIGVLKVPNEQN